MSFKIPLFQLNFDEQEELAVVETIRSKWISTGPKSKELESLFAEMTGAKHATTLSNCTSALHLAFKALGIEDGDEVICPSLTFVATVNAIKYVGGKPVFCDINSPEDLNIGAEKIEELITPRTKAIVVVHFAGFPCDMDPIMNLVKKHKLKLVEDACHAPLSEYNGQKIGTFGDVGCFSFFSNKNISTGEGGILVTNNESIDKKVRLLRSHGMTTLSFERAKGHATAYDVLDLGFNFRMDDIRASIGVVQVSKLPTDLDKRAKVREWYIQQLSQIESIHIPFINIKNFVSNYIVPIVLKDSNVRKRDAVRDKLHKAGIQTSVHYPAIHRFSIYQSETTDLPITEYVTDNEITLPMFGALTEEEVKYITSTLSSILDEA